ncbi:MAG: hypothetical protein KAT68_05995 [Bacteroidales bacterium]|nr:hypothetical protein [Bacteroidales bacterium]
MSKFLLNIFIIIIITFSHSFSQGTTDLVNICKSENGNAKYLKHFKVRFEKSKNPKKAPSADYTILLNKGNHYRFNVHNDSTKTGKAILTLYDDYNVFGSNFVESTGKEYKYFDFYCKRTNPYYISIKFKDGEEGAAVGMLSFVKRFNPN